MNPISAFSTTAWTGSPDAIASASTALRAGAADERTKLKEKAADFESVYLTQMLQPMFDNLEAEEPFGGGFGEDVWRSLQVQEYGKAIAKSGGIGLADTVAQQLIEVQEARNQAPS